MEVSSGASQPVAIDAQKKAQDVQSQQILTIIDNATEQSKQATAQKTGIGTSLNISG